MKKKKYNCDKTQIVTNLKLSDDKFILTNSNCYKTRIVTKKYNCEETQIVTKLKL